MPVVGTPSCRRRKRGHDERHDVAAGAGPAAALLCRASKCDGTTLAIVTTAAAVKGSEAQDTGSGGKRGGQLRAQQKKFWRDSKFLKGLTICHLNEIV